MGTKRFLGGLPTAKARQLARQLVTKRWPTLSLEPLDRKPAYVIIGAADVGGLTWCEAKATFSQKETEPGYARRISRIVSANSRSPRFAKPHEAVFALEAARPEEEENLPAGSESSPAWAYAEEEETRGAWHMAFSAAFDARAFGMELPCLVLLAGVTDGVLPSGTVIEVRQSNWDWRGIQDNRVTTEKEIQANIYAVMLGLKGWRCIFRCQDGRFVTEGMPDPAAAIEAIGMAARLRLGLDSPKGVAPEHAWKCRGGRCEYLQKCDATPLKAGP